MTAFSISAVAGPAPAAPVPTPDLSNPTAVAEALQKAFHDFQNTNNDALKGKASAETVDAINAEVTRLKTAYDEMSASVGRMTLGGGTSPEASSVASQARAFGAALGGTSPRQVSPEAYQDYQNAFSEAVRMGMNAAAMPADIRAALQVGIDPAGGYYTPVELSTELERRIFAASPLRQLARTITIGSNAWEGLYKDTRAKTGGWVGERQERPKTDGARGGKQRIEVHEIYAYPEVTQTVLEDASIDLAAMLLEDLDAEFAADESAAFVNGNGVSMPKGFLSYALTDKKDSERKWGTMQFVGSGAANGFPTLAGGGDNVDCFISATMALNPLFRGASSWMMNASTHAHVRKLKDNEGRYLIGLNQIEGGLEFGIHGRPVAECEDMPDIAAGATPIAVGDWKRGYLIVDRRGLRVVRDELTNKPYVGFYLTRRVGGDVRNFDALKFIKIAG